VPGLPIFMAPRAGVIGRRPCREGPGYLPRVRRENGVTLVASTLRRTSGESFVMETVPRLMHVENGHH
jgi:hypothetical protein